MGYPAILYAVTSIQEEVAQSGGLVRGTIDSEKEDYTVGQDGYVEPLCDRLPGRPWDPVKNNDI